MNKLYKVIFNKSLGAFVVVSEKTKSAFKVSSNISTDKNIDTNQPAKQIPQQFKIAILASCILLTAQQYYTAKNY